MATADSPADHESAGVVVAGSGRKLAQPEGLANASRICRRCGRSCPLSDFRCISLASGRRANECRRCYNARMRAYDRRKRARDNELAICEGWEWLSQHNIKFSVPRLLRQLMNRFGGADGLATAWISAWESTTPTRQLRATLALVRLLEWHERMVAQQQNPEGMSDAELAQAYRAEQRRMCGELLRDHPGDVKKIAKRLGYRLERLPTGEE